VGDVAVGVDGGLSAAGGALREMEGTLDVGVEARCLDF
jgi:hypothetical protein